MFKGLDQGFLRRQVERVGVVAARREIVRVLWRRRGGQLKMQNAKLKMQSGNRRKNFLPPQGAGRESGSRSGLLLMRSQIEGVLRELGQGRIGPLGADPGHVEGGEYAFWFAEIVPAHAADSDDRQTFGSLR